MGAENIVSLMSKLGKSKFDSQILYNITREFTDGAGKASKLLEGKAIQSLPEELRNFTSGLTRPKVKVTTISKQEGKGILGFQIYDGNKELMRKAVNIDRTGDAPILQFRDSVLQDGKCIAASNTITDANVSLNPSFQNIRTDGKTFIKVADENMNRAFSSSIYNSGEKIANPNFEIFIPKNIRSVKAKNINLMNEDMKMFFANNGKQKFSIDDCLDDIKKLALVKGKPTEQSVIKMKDTILKAMGYDTKSVPISFCDMGGSGGGFYPALGKLELNSKFIEKATNAEVAMLLSHEITHMNDYIKLVKKIGVEKFEKLSGFPVNREFYEKAGKYIDVRDFNAKPFIEELKRDVKLSNSKFTGRYKEALAQYNYVISPLEINARTSAGMVAAKLGNVETTAATLRQHISAPNAFLEELMPKIESKLGNLGPVERSQKFNEACKKANIDVLEMGIKHQYLGNGKSIVANPEYAQLVEKFKTQGSLSDTEAEKFQEFIMDKWKNDDFQLNIFQRVIDLL